MRKTAGFLKIITVIGIVFHILALILLVLCEVFFLFSGAFSDLIGKVGSGSPITIDGAEITPELIAAAKPVLLVSFGLLILIVLLSLIAVLRVKKVLEEVHQERPFSHDAVTGLRFIARMRLVCGFVGVAASVIMFIMMKEFTINGINPGTSTISVDLGFIVAAVMDYMLYHIAEYGSSLDNHY